MAKTGLVERIGNATLYLGDCLAVLRELPEQSVNTCITSPPYWGLRDYGVDGQIGLEPTLKGYIDRMVWVFRQVRRVLRDDGTVWLNLGDSYAGSRSGNQGKYGGMANRSVVGAIRNVSNVERQSGLKPKDLIGIPWRVAFALQADGAADWRAVQILQRVISELVEAYDGEPLPDRVTATVERLRTEWQQAKGDSWYLRQDIIWHKPSPMPESVKDRCTKAHEYIFLLSKKPRYYFDQESIKEPRNYDYNKPVGSWASGPGSHSSIDHNQPTKGSTTKYSYTNNGRTMASATRNKRSVWTVASKPYAGAHFATFPPDLIEPCVMAGCPAGGTVLDPFSGSGTTGMVALQQGRRYIGIELNPEYIALSVDRIRPAARQARLFA